MKAAAGAPEEEISLDDKVWTLLVDFATTDRSQKKALRRIRDEIIQTVALDCDKRRLALIDADSKLRAERDKRLADKLNGWLEVADAHFDDMPITTFEVYEVAKALSNTQTETEESA